MTTLILKLDVAGRPIGWVSREAGALLYCRNQVAWEAGEHFVHLRGGYSRLLGTRSVLNVNTIIATRSLDRVADIGGVPALTNRQLFRRDGFMCLYCARQFAATELTRDHVTPTSRGGRDTWENVVTACRTCNHRKDNRTATELDAVGMRLVAVPYAPNRAEALILANRRILADQMAFLRSHIGKMSRLNHSS
ncbi:MAG: HNH endonuclease [Gammaproteobacteria bacterium]|nr:HNH endonuclease [Gammaproteobacteria bacterium]